MKNFNHATPNPKKGQKGPKRPVSVVMVVIVAVMSIVALLGDDASSALLKQAQYECGHYKSPAQPAYCTDLPQGADDE